MMYLNLNLPKRFGKPFWVSVLLPKLGFGKPILPKRFGTETKKRLPEHVYIGPTSVPDGATRALVPDGISYCAVHKSSSTFI
jgi:hypothetical protein